MFAVKALLPTAVLFEAVVFASKEPQPIAVLLDAVLTAKALYPKAALEAPVELALNVL